MPSEEYFETRIGASEEYFETIAGIARKAIKSWSTSDDMMIDLLRKELERIEIENGFQPEGISLEELVNVYVTER